MALLLFGGSVTSTAQFFSASTESESYAYFIKGADPRSGNDKNNIRYWTYDGTAIVHTTTVPTTDDDAYKFKIYTSATTGKYYIYSVGAQQYLYCKNTGAGKDKVGLKAEKADDALWYIPNDGIGPNGIVNFVPGSLNLENNTVGWNIHEGTSKTNYIGLYDRSDDGSQWYLIPSDLTTLNNFRSLAANTMQGETADYGVSKSTRPASFPTSDYESWTIENATSIVSSLSASYPALPTGYYTIANCATDGRKKYIYGDLTNNPNGYTLQSSTRVLDSKGCWKVTNNGNGTINIVNSNGDPIITMNNNAPTLYSTLHMAYADGGNGIYFTEAINASNGGTKINDIPCLTTWAYGGINALDNRWAFSEVVGSPYTINIYAPSNYKLGWRNLDSDSEYTTIKRGGFFVDFNEGYEDGSMNSYKFVLLDGNGSVVSGVTPVVDTEARTITATLSELPSGYYRVVSAFTGGTAAAKGWTSYQTQSHKLGWEVADANNGEQYWFIEGNATNGYKIRSAYFDCKKYIALAASNDKSNTSYSLVEEANASTFNINLIANSDQYTIQATNNSYPLHGQYLSDSWSAGPFTTWAGEANSASAWYFVPATELEAAVASLNTYTAGVDFSKQVGTKVGQYSEPEGTTTEGLQELTNNYATYKPQVVTALASGNVATMETAYNNFKTNVKDLITTDRTTAYGTLVINQPEAGKLYRFKGHASGKYICPTNATGKMNLNASRDKAATVFMLVEGSEEGKFKLLNYKHGYFTRNTYELGVSKDACNSIQISESTSNIGCYRLQSNGANNSGDNYGSWFVDYTTVVERQSNYNANSCDWEIEEVTWLPIDISTVYKFGTLVAPADLALASGGSYGVDARLKFYTATIGTDGYVELKKVTENIKAGEPYVIELISESGMSEGNQFMEITTGAPDLTADNALRGGFETVTTAEGTIYTLQAAYDATAENNVSANEVAFRQYNGATIQGFRAYLPVAGNVRIAGMRIVDGDVTRIEGVSAEESHKVDVYDLSGRRVQRATKGLYIINGKKVIVK